MAIEKMKPPSPTRFKWIGDWNGFNKLYFESKEKKDHFTYLLLLESAGDITKLELNHKFIVSPKSKSKSGKNIPEKLYTGDFLYYQKIKQNHDHLTLICDDLNGHGAIEFERMIRPVKDKYPDVLFREARA